jgi:1,4-alpha-glucan branching enzyme
MPKNKNRGSAKSVAPLCTDVDFVLEYSQAENVYVCGDFNDWQPVSLSPMDGRQGLWKKRLSLPPGRYEYKFVVDGNWIPDPAARESAQNGYGSLNSILEIGDHPNGDPHAKKGSPPAPVKP